MEEAAKDEIREIVQHKEAVMKRMAELEAERNRAEKESEDMGVMWGMGKLCLVGMPWNIELAGVQAHRKKPFIVRGVVVSKYECIPM